LAFESYFETGNFFINSILEDHLRVSLFWFAPIDAIEPFSSTGCQSLESSTKSQLSDIRLRNHDRPI